jgi:hypothetical protein
MSGFDTIHPVAHRRARAQHRVSFASARCPVRSASAPSPVPGYVPNSRPASALELKRRPFPDRLMPAAEAATSARHGHPSSRSCRGGSADGPKTAAARKSRRCGDLPPAPSDPPRTAMPARRQSQLSGGCRTCHSRQRLRPKTWLPVANRAVGAGSPGVVCVVDAVSRFAAPNDPAQTVLPRQGAPKSLHRLPA